MRNATDQAKLSHNVVAGGPDIALAIDEEDARTTKSAANPCGTGGQADRLCGDVHRRVIANNALVGRRSIGRHLANKVRNAVDCCQR